MTPLVPLGEFAVARGGSVDPARFKDEEFDLYSIPAYDAGEPEVAKGSEIGSSKKVVQPGDVLLSRIVPHIRRVWVVGPNRGRRQIASGEWILYRGDKFDNGYLRHFLMADPFHQQFMRTVSGVGGSLLRARPSEVANINVPVPELAEQKRIAVILDKADAIRRKRQQAIELADQFLRAVFLDMFGDPVTNPKGWETRKLGSLVKVVSGATPSKSREEFWTGDYPWVSPKDMKSIGISGAIDSISEQVFEETNQKKVPAGAILVVVRGMILAHTVPIGITLRDVAINQDIKAFLCGQELIPDFLLWLLKVQHDHLLSKVSTAAHGTKRFDVNDLLDLDLILPNDKLQADFVQITRTFEKFTGRSKELAGLADSSFSALSQQAFSGAL